MKHSAAAEPLTTTTRVLIVDDEPALRLVLRTILDRDHRYQVEAEAGEGREAIALAERHQPDVVLLDLLMPGMGGRDALPAILSVSPRSMVVILSALSATDEAEPSFAAGAFAYLEKSLVGPRLADEIDTLQQRFRRALAGETVWTPDARGRIRR